MRSPCSLSRAAPRPHAGLGSYQPDTGAVPALTVFPDGAQEALFSIKSPLFQGEWCQAWGGLRRRRRPLQRADYLGSCGGPGNGLAPVGTS